MCFFFTSPGNSIFTLSIDGRSTRPSVGLELSDVASQIPWAIAQFLRISKAWIKQKEQSGIRQEPNMCAGISVSKGCLTIILLIDYRFVHFSYCFFLVKMMSVTIVTYDFEMEKVTRFICHLLFYNIQFHGLACGNRSCLEYDTTR